MTKAHLAYLWPGELKIKIDEKRAITPRWVIIFTSNLHPTWLFSLAEILKIFLSETIKSIEL
jgi:hypothetical protein